MYTKQEMLDRVYEHFITNGQPRGLSEYGGCVYEGKDGCRCAIGLFIPDGHAGLNFEGTAKGLLIYYPELATLINDDAGFLLELQKTHDNSRGIEGTSGFQRRLQQLAKDYGLRYPGDPVPLPPLDVLKFEVSGSPTSTPIEVKVFGAKTPKPGDTYLTGRSTVRKFETRPCQSFLFWAIVVLLGGGALGYVTSSYVIIGH